MSQRVVSQKIERTCEGCGAIKVYELMSSSDSELQELQNWYTIVREVYYQGQLAKLMVQACSPNCISAAAAKLVLPPDDGQNDAIDLASLQTHRDPVIN